jgi:hypothetical protein
VTTVTHPDVRASDEDRRRVVTQLERHTAEGRLTLEEFSDRVARVYAATTNSELAALTRDLPTPAPNLRDPGREQRQLVIAIALALVTVAALAVIFAFFRS